MVVRPPQEKRRHRKLGKSASREAVVSRLLSRSSSSDQRPSFSYCRDEEPHISKGEEDWTTIEEGAVNYSTLLVGEKRQEELLLLPEVISISSFDTARSSRSSSPLPSTFSSLPPLLVKNTNNIPKPPGSNSSNSSSSNSSSSTTITAAGDNGTHRLNKDRYSTVNNNYSIGGGNIVPAKYIPALAVDCEMVGCIDDQQGLARISIVDEQGGIVLDSYVNPPYKILDYRSSITGIFPHTLFSAIPYHIIRQKNYKYFKKSNYHWSCITK